MNSPQESNEARVQQAERITAQPQQYKVCEGCGSIVVARAVTCPSCHAYCFDSAVERVVAQAQNLARKTPQSVTTSDLH